ncbi:type IIL restriction-modification enzyme MmeI [uncultured Microbacterium sp.]|uniref:type IIL restriction-modification enzyme MmeI n=1 Tax=uncultured Microbacterium sp. TaxID=191216 RepID=UPI00262AEB38|nr:type IIL restriction-modification enzyme MmeI [uncultured Microbacterium sp.]
MQANGTLGLIATNTVAQGDSREVGLNAMVAAGVTITRAIQSRSWPAASANLEYAAVWGTRGSVNDELPRVADDVSVRRISTLLEASGRVDGMPERLAENTGLAFIGCYVLGMGFVVEPDEAQEWIAADARNAEVLFPYLNGEDLNQRPDGSGSRWVIDFGGRSQEESAEFLLPYRRLSEQVRPERARKPKAVREAPWWLFLRSRPAMRKAIADLSEVLVIALVSKTVMPMRVSTGQVFSHMLGVFAIDDYGAQAVLSSTLHRTWAITYGSTLETRVRYTPSDVFETFPLPPSTQRLAAAGRTLERDRREVMLRRNLGLTNLYNLIDDPGVQYDPDVARLRDIHVEIDEATVEAYGWDDLRLSHGFHSYRQVERWSVSSPDRVETLDRLLLENQRRATASGIGSGRRLATTRTSQTETLFD